MDPPLAQRLSELKSRLEKKATFEAAISDFAALLSKADAKTVEVCGALRWPMALSDLRCASPRIHQPTPLFCLRACETENDSS